MSQKPTSDAAEYESPTLTTVGSVEDLTAGPITTYDESPSGMKGSRDKAARPDD
jgi:hypothetical protein